MESNPHLIAARPGRCWKASAVVAGLLVVLVSACERAPSPPAEGPLRIAFHGDPSTLDPYLQSEAVAQSILGNVYESLVALDVDMSLVPVLARQWESPEPRVVRFHLRDDVYFHDGRLMSATDVEFSIERARRHPRSQRASSLVAIEAVDILDEGTIDIRTAYPYPLLLNKLSHLQIVPAGAPEEITEPLGTGPYRFIDFEPGKSLRLRAWESYRGGPPEVEELELVFVSDPEERVRQLLEGEVHLIDELPPAEVARIEEIPGFQVLSRSGLMVTYLQVNPTVAPFDDLRVRRALDLAFDREALVQGGLHGYGQALGQMLSPNVYGFVPELTPPSPDLEEARRLLAEAGHATGLELTLEYREGRPENLVETLRAQLAAVGIRLELVVRPWGEMYARLQTGEVPFYLGGWLCTSGDASDLLDNKVHSYDLQRGYGTANSNRYSNPEIDALIEQSDAMKMESRREVLERALRLLQEDHVFFPLYTEADLYAIVDSLDWMPRRDGRVYGFEIKR
jgi:peptide/nickel transport system substrate-binding protein